MANAILDGTDGIMLSAETAAGRYPGGVGRDHGADRALHGAAGAAAARRTAPTAPSPPVASSLARVANSVAEELDCKVIVAFTASGATARLVSSFRPRAPIAAITHKPEIYRQLALWWGVVPVQSTFVATTDDMIAQGDALLKREGLVQTGDTVLMLAGQSHTTGATNMLRVHTIS